MAKTSSFGYTNKSDVERTRPEYLMGLVQNYALVTEDPDQVVVDNTLAPLDQQELITYQSRTLPRINSGVVNNFPATTTAGVQYVVKVEELLSTVDSDSGVRVDEPITMYVVVKHPRSGNITSDIVTEVWKRLNGALMKSDGTYRWAELMRSALKPVED